MQIVFMYTCVIVASEDAEINIRVARDTLCSR
jgi:hypothetical protein